MYRTSILGAQFNLFCWDDGRLVHSYEMCHEYACLLKPSDKRPLAEEIQQTETFRQLDLHIIQREGMEKGQQRV